MRRLIIDRFEGNYAVCEQKDKSIINILKLDLPDGVIEGSCLVIDANGLIHLDVEEYENRKDKIEKLMDDLFE